MLVFPDQLALRISLTIHYQADLNEGCYGTVTTEVQIVRSTAPPIHVKPCESSNASSNAAPTTSLEPNPPLSAQTCPPSQYYSSVTSPCRTAQHHHPSPLSRVASATRSVASKFVIEDPIKRAYLRTSFLFAISVLVTWIPSSMNRIHSWLAGSSPFEYHVATAAVLPLQGLWNAIIFFVTSWSTVRRTSKSGSVQAHPDGIDRVRAEVPAARCGIEQRDDCYQSETDLEDGDSRTMGSEIELQQLSKLRNGQHSELCRVQTTA